MFMKHLNRFNENKRSRDEVIELLSSSSNFEKEELQGMSDSELEELWDSLEMDNWLNELQSESDMNESSSFIILLAAWFLYDTLSKIPKKQWTQYIMENTKEMFTDFVSFLSKYGYPVDIEVLKGKIDNIFRLALGKLYKEGGIVDWEKGEINESLPRQHTVDQLKALRKMTKGTDIGDRIPDLMKQGANIHYSRNVVDTGIESYEDYEKHNKKFVPSWNLKHLMSPFRGESKSKKKK